MSQEIITVAQMRAIDAASADAGVPTRTLMENAGRAVADAAMARFPEGGVAVLCGPGNNGGDGWVAAHHLRQRGRDVRVETLVDPGALRGDAADAARVWIERGGEVLHMPRGRPASVYVDALFGAGLTRPLEGEAARLAAALPAASVVAVDVPSGLDGDSGRPVGDVCVRAALTVTFVRKKPAHVLYPGRGLCGAVIVADIGAPASVVAAQGVRLWENAPCLWRARFPWPNAEAHKHARGHVMVASGGAGRSGAARLAARGALRAGAGLVTVLSPRDAMAENAAQLTAIMLREVASADALGAALEDAGALVIGPAFGVSDAHRDMVRAALDAKRPPFVLDADALTLLAPLTTALTPRDVLTPHLGEFKRLFPDLAGSSASKVERTRAAAKRANAIVLLKGPDTVIAAPDGRAVVNVTGTPYLATAGAGDVLAGIIAGLIGQGMASFDAACAGACMHGRAAELFGPGLISEDLPELLPRVLRDLSE